MKRISPCLGIFLSILLFILTSQSGFTTRQEISPTEPINLPPLPAQNRGVPSTADFGRMPLSFIANKGQVNELVGYYVQGRDKTLYFTADGVTIVLAEAAEMKNGRSPAGLSRRVNPIQDEGPESGWRDAGRWTVQLKFVGANRVKPGGEELTKAVVSYFKGKPADWRAGIPTCSRIRYKDLWSGIDLVYSGDWNKLKYEFVVQPGADPGQIRLGYRGITSLNIGENGALEVSTPGGGFRDGAPLAFQEMNGEKVRVPLAYKIMDKKESGEAAEDGEMKSAGDESAYSFEVGDYDRTRPLILDPVVLIYCGYVGGSAAERAMGIALDAGDNVYIAGETGSSELSFPVAAGPDLTHNGNYDAFVAKVNPSGTGLVYCGYIGGSGNESAYGIAVDAGGNAYVVGDTFSTESTFPVKTGPDLTSNGGVDGFAVKVNASGTALEYCGFIGGSEPDRAFGVTVNAAGNAYVVGYTSSAEGTFPVVTGPDTSYNGGGDAFVAEVSPTGADLEYCGYIGGSGSEEAHAIALDGNGNAFVTGNTTSNEASFPVLVGPDLSFNGTYDAFVAKVNSSGTAFLYCGYIGGSDDDIGMGIAVDAAGNAYISGHTNSNESSFPVLVGPDLSFNGGTDTFVAKIGPSGANIIYCGYIGGAYQDSEAQIAVDACGTVYLSGMTGSPETSFPVKAGPDLTHNGSYDAFVAKLNPKGTGLVYCGYIGGSGSDSAYDIRVDASGNAYVCGGSGSAESTFPVNGGPDLTYNGGYDAFVAKVIEEPLDKPRHAVGDFDGDGKQEAAVDFGSGGVWLYDSPSWTQLTPNNPEELLAADVDGDSSDEIIADLGAQGLWQWDAGAWSEISTSNPELLAAGSTYGASAVVAVDFGPSGLWAWSGGAWSQLSGADANGLVVKDVNGWGGVEVSADFGPTGAWLWLGSWLQLSAADADYMATAEVWGYGQMVIVGDFGVYGLWAWNGTAWFALSGVDPDFIVPLEIDGTSSRELAGDFGTAGLWLRSDSSWTQLSGANADFMIRADLVGTSEYELLADFGTLGLWVWHLSGGWTQLSGVNPEYVFAADLSGDYKHEILADFGPLGLWMWSGGAWSQISANNPD